MTTVTKMPLSEGPANGSGLFIVPAGSPGALVHIAVTGTSSFDEVWLYSSHDSLVSGFMVVQFGSLLSTSAIDHIVGPLDGLDLLVPGLIINNGLEVRVYAPAAGNVVIFGFVNRITG